MKKRSLTRGRLDSPGRHAAGPGARLVRRSSGSKYDADQTSRHTEHDLNALDAAGLADPKDTSRRMPGVPRVGTQSL
jgi:hypothetical protein